MFVSAAKMELAPKGRYGRRELSSIGDGYHSQRPRFAPEQQQQVCLR